MATALSGGTEDDAGAETRSRQRAAERWLGATLFGTDGARVAERGVFRLDLRGNRRLINKPRLDSKFFDTREDQQRASDVVDVVKS
jgi:hypothetical protein